MRLSRALPLLVTLSLVALPVHAGDASSPEITDPAGDVSHTVTPSDENLCGLPPEAGGGNGATVDMSSVDILAAWIESADLATFQVHVSLAAAPDAATLTTVSFGVVKTAASEFGSTANGASHGATATGDQLTNGPADTVVSLTGTELGFLFNRTSVGASGGDAITNLQVVTSKSVDEEHSPACTETESGTDLAPDSGVAPAFNLSRIPVVADVVISFVEGFITEDVRDANGNITGTFTRALTASNVETEDPNATASFLFQAINLGTDVENITFELANPAVLDAANASFGFTPATASLDPGNQTDLWLNFTLVSAPVGAAPAVIVMDGHLGSAGIAAATVTVKPPPAPPVTPPVTGPGPDIGGEEEPAERSPAIGGLGWLTSTAETVGFVDAFDDWAEVVLLAIIVLLLILIIFLAAMLAPRSIVAIRVHPHVVRAAPGETAEFDIMVRNKKRRFRDAAASFDGDATWNTGLLLQQSEGAALHPLTKPGQHARMALSAKREPGDHFAGTMRVKVPSNARHHEKDRLAINIEPVDDDGQVRGRGRGSARVTVIADDPEGIARGAAGSIHSAQGSPIRLAKVVHAPMAPIAGQQVVTTVTLENDAPETLWHLNVVLMVDGEVVSETPVEMPARTGRAVQLPWTAGSGANAVKVQVFQDSHHK